MALCLWCPVETGGEGRNTHAHMHAPVVVSVMFCPGGCPHERGAANSWAINWGLEKSFRSWVSVAKSPTARSLCSGTVGYHGNRRTRVVVRSVGREKEGIESYRNQCLAPKISHPLINSADETPSQWQRTNAMTVPFLLSCRCAGWFLSWGNLEPVWWNGHKQPFIGQNGNCSSRT